MRLAGGGQEVVPQREVLDREMQKSLHSSWPKVVYENIDGSHKLEYPDKSTLDVHIESMHPLRKMQVRLPNQSAQAMVDCSIANIQSNNLFYMLNKFEDDGTPRIVLLDQTALVCAMRTVCPTLNIACAYGIALNVLVRYGVNADINGACVGGGFAPKVTASVFVHDLAVCLLARPREPRSPRGRN